MLPLTFAVSMSCCVTTGLIFTRTCPSHSLCLIPLPLSELPWKILCAHVDLKFQLLNWYKLKLWLAAFSPEAGKKRAVVLTTGRRKRGCE